MRILIAEDDPKLLKSLVYIFEMNHYAVDGVDNGVDAYDLAIDQDTDAVTASRSHCRLKGLEGSWSVYLGFACRARHIRHLGLVAVPQFILPGTEPAVGFQILWYLFCVNLHCVCLLSILHYPLQLALGQQGAVLTKVEEDFFLHPPLRMRMPFGKKFGNFFEKFSLSSVRAEKVIPFHFTTEELRTAFSMKFKFLYENSATFAYIVEMTPPH